MIRVMLLFLVMRALSWFFTMLSFWVMKRRDHSRLDDGSCFEGEPFTRL